jgi:hypothetical protein
MMIGEQAQVTMTVQAAEGAKIEMPVFQPRQQIVAGVEVINVEHPTGHSLLLTLTSFDGNLYYLPPFKVKVNGKTDNKFFWYNHNNRSYEKRVGY